MQINVGSTDLKVISFKLDSGSLALSVIAFSMTLRQCFFASSHKYRCNQFQYWKCKNYASFFASSNLHDMIFCWKKPLFLFLNCIHYDELNQDDADLEKGFLYDVVNAALTIKQRFQVHVIKKTSIHKKGCLSKDDKTAWKRRLDV